jgi:hypothetical protein
MTRARFASTEAIAIAGTAAFVPYNHTRMGSRMMEELVPTTPLRTPAPRLTANRSTRDIVGGS